MAYCGPRGIPLSVFLGRVVGPGDPAWLRSDRDAAVEWAAHEARRCGSCGTHPDDWADNRHAHHAHLSDQCPGCLQKHRRTEAVGKDGLPPGVHVILPRGPAAACPRCKPRD
ncbi:hypothetical protein [Blastococcus sp. CCUG 61487]|uniref:hypothetical protein n=1 Tax=Blastococcus sp. CCUG 61487 TaxID=1840703 RepID=UPI0010BFA6D7|nr:hypothetical protein [Blastococcus sp. CCUG 61487]TKJ24367.1 hypothetical protein A6V29_05050 [Blastococcus sp. CCUG 61487]